MSARNEAKRKRVLAALSDPDRARSTADIARHIGISARTIARWQRDPVLAGELATMTSSKADHEPAEPQAETPMPAESEGIISEAMQALRGIARDPKQAGYVKVNAWRALVEMALEHRAVSELRQELDELKNGG